MVRSSFGEILSCCCLSALPDLAWVLLNYVFCTPFCAHLYSANRLTNIFFPRPTCASGERCAAAAPRSLFASLFLSSFLFSPTTPTDGGADADVLKKSCQTGFRSGSFASEERRGTDRLWGPITERSVGFVPKSTEILEG